MIPVLLSLLLTGHGAEPHALGTLPEVPAAAAELPVGPPRAVAASPGQDLAALIRTLPAGSTLTLAPGTYAGPVLVDRPLTLAGEGAHIEGGGRGTVLVIAAPDVTVRGLRLSGSGSDSGAGDSGVLVGADRFKLEALTIEDTYIGVDVRQANQGWISGCTIRGRRALAMGLRGDGIRLWESDQNRIEDNRIEDVRDVVVWYSYQNTLARNVVTGARYGTHFMHASDNRVEDNAYDGDVVGVFVMYSDHIELLHNRVSGARGEAGVGFGFKDSDDPVVRGNALLGNTTGVYLDGTPHRIGGQAVFEENLVALNHAGVRVHGSLAGALFQHNQLHENPVQVLVDGGGDALGVRFEGNAWSDYAGYDLDGDGVGDLPYRLFSATNGLLDRHPQLRFFHGTPAAGLLDLLAAAFPMFAPPPLLQDAHPRVGDQALAAGPRPPQSDALPAIPR